MTYRSWMLGPTVIEEFMRFEGHVNGHAVQRRCRARQNKLTDQSLGVRHLRSLGRTRSLPGNMFPRLSCPSLLQRPSLPQWYLDRWVFTCSPTINAVLTVNLHSQLFSGKQPGFLLGSHHVGRCSPHRTLRLRHSEQPVRLRVWARRCRTLPLPFVSSVA